MTALDHGTFVALAEAMAATNGYAPIQGSDKYIHAGTTIDWTYGVQRIFSFIYEMYPVDSLGQSLEERFYPPDEVIADQVQRNREAVLYLLEIADCPYRAVGKGAAYCGPFFDDLEMARTWVVDPGDGTPDTATVGAWQRGDPTGTSSHGPKQLGSSWSGRAAFVTGLDAGGCATCNDVDGGTTSVRSGPIEVPGGGTPHLRLRYFLGHRPNATTGDGFRIAVIQGGARTVVFRARAVPGADRDAEWRKAVVDLSPWTGESVRIQLEATDTGADSLIEAGVDEVRVTAH